MEVFLFFFFYSKWRAWHVVIGRGVGRVVAAPAQQKDVQRGWMPNVQGGVLQFALLIFSKWEVVALSPINALLDFWQDFFFASSWLFRLWLVQSDATRSSLAEHGVVINSIQLEVKKFDWLLEDSWEKKRYTFFWRESTSSFPSGYQTSPALYCI